MTPLDPDEARELPEPDKGTLEPPPKSLAAALEAANLLPMPERCPLCQSPDPRRHPATQFEGEVQPCPHPWHGVAKPLYEVGDWGWICEDCHYFTVKDDEANAHSDKFKHSLARCPRERWEAKDRTHRKRRQRKRQKARQEARIRELESQLGRTLKIAAAALERCEVSNDPSGAAAEAEMLLRQVVTLSGKYVARPVACEHEYELGNAYCLRCGEQYPDDVVA